MEEAPEDEFSVEILEDIPPSPKTREKTPLPCRQSYKKMKTSLTGKADQMFENQNTEPFENPKKNKDSHCSASKIKSVSGFPAKIDGGGSSSTERFLKQSPEFCGEKHTSNINEKALIQRNIASKSEKPYFKVVMQRSYIQKGYLSVPSEFSKRHLTKKPATVILQVLDGRTWSVQLKYHHERSEARFQSCWPLFVRENNLKVGDACVFTLINCIAFVFEVVFYPAAEAANCPLSPGGRGAIYQVKSKGSPIIEVESECGVICGIGVSGSLETGKNKMSKTSVQVTERPSSSLTAPLDNHHEAANNFVSENPFFKVTLGSSHMEKSVVHVPASFAWSFIKRKKQKVMLQVTDRLWPVDSIAFKPSLASFSSGWATFVEEYSLRVGDVCIFELMEMNDDIILQVHFFRC
ncbi:B3 domain-containing transcription factor VRN1 [Rosa sericea]